MAYTQYRDRWRQRFAQFLADAGLASSEATALEEVFSGEDESERFHQNAMNVAVATVRERAEQKLTPAYLRESLGDGYKYAYDQELAFESEERGTEFLLRLLRQSDPVVAETYREQMSGVDPAAALDFLFWGELRRRWSAAKRKKEPLRVADWTVETILSALS